MKRRISQVLIILILLLATLSLLSACNLFGNTYSIKTVDVFSTRGLTLDGNEYVAESNKEFRLGLDWHNDRVPTPDIKWYVSKGGTHRKIEGESSKYLEYTLSEQVGEVVEIYAEVAETKSGVIRIRVDSAEISVPTITSATHTIVGDVIQQKVGDAKDVALVAQWNEQSIDQSLPVDIAWFVDGERAECTDSNFDFHVSAIEGRCKKTVKVEITQGEVSKSSEVQLVFVDKCDLMSGVEISICDEDAEHLCADTYYIYGTQTESTKLPLFANADDFSNVYAKCEWSVRNKSGEYVIADKSRSVTANLTYGKHVITATVENVKSRALTVYVLHYDSDEIPEQMLDGINNTFLWHGDYCDSYVNDMTDLSNVVGYSLSKQQMDVSYSMYLAKENWRNANEYSTAVSEAISTGNDESGYFSYTATVLGATGYVKFMQGSKWGKPCYKTTSQYHVRQANNFVRYKQQSVLRASLPIDSSTQTQVVSNSNELYRAVSNGIKPEFKTDANGNALSSLYQKARRVLLDYINDDMTEREKTDVIFDWIVNKVEYDYQLLENMATQASYDCNSFFLEGVFNDKRAVCDGKSKAFCLLCGMEGIRSMRIVGEANGSGHAWNKVCIDANGDGVREWYVVDTTWGDISVKDESKNITEYVNLSYYLARDEDISSTHSSNIPQPSATTSFNVFKTISVSVSGAEVNFFVQTKIQRELLVEYSRENDNMCLCVYLTENAQTAVYGDMGLISLGNDVYVIFAEKGLFGF